MSRREGTRERPGDAATGRSGSPDRRLVALQLVAGLALIAFGWTTSLAGIEPFRGYWFDLVWSGFILAADAVVWARAGRSLLHGGGWRVLAMFALSAPFWWAFEIANWRLENWRYVGEQLFAGPARMPLKTLSFLFVLPAGRVARPAAVLRPLPAPAGHPAPSWTAPALVAGGLVCVPLLYLAPDQTFPLVWLAPLAVLDGIAELRGRPSIVGLVRQGRAGPVLLLAVAGLGTGILWELWNWGRCPPGSTASRTSASGRCSRCRSSATSATRRSSWPRTRSGACSAAAGAASPRGRSPNSAGSQPIVHIL